MAHDIFSMLVDNAARDAHDHHRSFPGANDKRSGSFLSLRRHVMLVYQIFLTRGMPAHVLSMTQHQSPMVYFAWVTEQVGVMYPGFA